MTSPVFQNETIDAYYGFLRLLQFLPLKQSVSRGHTVGTFIELYGMQTLKKKRESIFRLSVQEEEKMKDMILTLDGVAFIAGFTLLVLLGILQALGTHPVG